MWLLGNISADCVKYRDELITCGFINKIIEVLNRPKLGIDLLKLIAWNILNVFKGQVLTKLETVLVRCYTLG
jgi:hypothetical protein